MLVEPEVIFIIRPFPADLSNLCACGKLKCLRYAPLRLQTPRTPEPYASKQAASSITKLLNNHLFVSGQEKDRETLLYDFQSLSPCYLIHLPPPQEPWPEAQS